MESITIMDGLILTVVCMLVVFIVLAAIWGLIELVAKLVHPPSADLKTAGAPSANKQPALTEPRVSDTLAPNAKHQQVAELMALVLASEDEPNKKFEIVESKRVK